MYHVCMGLCVCVCMGLCVREREIESEWSEREREKESEREKEREREREKGRERERWRERNTSTLEKRWYLVSKNDQECLDKLLLFCSILVEVVMKSLLPTARNKRQLQERTW